MPRPKALEKLQSLAPNSLAILDKPMDLAKAPASSKTGRASAPMPKVTAPALARDAKTSSTNRSNPTKAHATIDAYPRTSAHLSAKQGESVRSQSRLVANPVTSQPAVSEAAARAADLLTEVHRFAQTASTEEEFTRVIQQCRRVQAIDQTSAARDYASRLGSWALNKRGEVYADASRISEAMMDFEAAIAMDTNRWRAIHNRGVLLAQSGHYAQAFEDFNRTINLNPRFAKAYSNRASLYVPAGEFSTALEDYRRAIEMDPDLAVAHKGRGRVCHLLGKLEEAIQHLDAATLLAPKDGSIAACRADLLVDMGRYSQATVGYQRAIELAPTLVSAYRNLAWLQATCPEEAYRDGDKALANARKALEMSDQADDVTLDTLAAAQAASGDFESAIATMERALALAPTSDQPTYALRLQLYRQGKSFRSRSSGDVQQTAFDDRFE